MNCVEIIGEMWIGGACEFVGSIVSVLIFRFERLYCGYIQHVLVFWETLKHARRMGKMATYSLLNYWTSVQTKTWHTHIYRHAHIQRDRETEL